MGAQYDTQDAKKGGVPEREREKEGEAESEKDKRKIADLSNLSLKSI